VILGTVLPKPNEHPADMQLTMLGDSDIARWPPHLYPQCPTLSEVKVDGYSGATMQDILSKFLPANTSDAILVVCAGENDIGSGIEIDHTLRSFDTLLQNVGSYRHILVLGPKFEPWLNDDAKSRKQYFKLHKGLQRRCDGKINVTYLDCLTMFCGSTSALLKGATLGGQAKADPQFFADDELHLNDNGYDVWKVLIENELSKLAHNL
jgi:lysophospholipase L1-like esterase